MLPAQQVACRSKLRENEWLAAIEPCRFASLRLPATGSSASQERWPGLGLVMSTATVPTSFPWGTQ